MKITVLDFPGKIEVELRNVSQLCGQNIKRKHVFVNALAKYFSNDKYTDVDVKYQQTIMIDDEQVGRNYMKVIRISGIEDILSSIKVGKTTLLSLYIKSKLEEFYCQEQLIYIDDKLSEIFNCMNHEIEKTIGNLQLDYSISDLWDIVQKSKVYSANGEPVDRKTPLELLHIFSKLLMANIMNTSEKVLLIVENIDHLLSIEEYKIFLHEMDKYGELYGVYTLVTTSLEGYALITENTIEGITVFNSADFGFPGKQRLLTFINENYPFNRKMECEEMFESLEKIIQKIGKIGYMIEDDDVTICKLINDTVIQTECRKHAENKAITAFLRGDLMI